MVDFGTAWAISELLAARCSPGAEHRAAWRIGSIVEARVTIEPTLIRAAEAQYVAGFPLRELLT